MICEWSGGCPDPKTVIVQVEMHYGISLCTWHLFAYLDAMGISIKDEDARK